MKADADGAAEDAEAGRRREEAVPLRAARKCGVTITVKGLQEGLSKSANLESNAHRDDGAHRVVYAPYLCKPNRV